MTGINVIRISLVDVLLDKLLLSFIIFFLLVFSVDIMRLHVGRNSINKYKNIIKFTNNDMNLFC